MSNQKFIISGGGTGGHIFPAIAIANAIKEELPEAEILFIGADNRMEMSKVPDAGYQIKGLPIQGIDRKNPFKIFATMWKLFRSIRLSHKIIKDFKPNAAVGVGGYASAAALYVAHKYKIPIVLQEQNQFPGLTNKLLKKKAAKICVAYPDMEKFFPKEKILLTGNPVRQNLVCTNKDAAFEYFNLSQNLPTMLVIGGSLGARSINNAIINNLSQLENLDIQLIWQTGANYFENAKNALQEKLSSKALYKIHITPFISRMDYAFAAADLVISRAGASSISELAMLKKAAILCPSPNVAEDHQTKNAQSLSSKNAAILIPDAEANSALIQTAISTLNDKKLLDSLSQNIANFAIADSAKIIAKQVISLAKPFYEKH